MTFSFFDSHCHLELTAFDADRADVVASMKQAGIGALVVGVDSATSNEATLLAEQHEHLFSAIGLHPNDAPEESFDIDLFSSLAKHPKVVAIGECGLDYYRLPTDSTEDKKRQKELFEKHIALSITTKKPLTIHCREAFDDLLDILRYHRSSLGAIPGVMHFFTGSIDVARRCLDLGFMLSFSGVITFTEVYDEVVRFVPNDRLLVETDSPFATPAPNRGKRNSPLFLPLTIEAMARIRGTTADVLAPQLLTNTQSVFKVNH